jgi:hypothetical protein
MSNHGPQPTQPAAESYESPARLEWRANVDKRLDDGAATMKALRAESQAYADALAENTRLTKAILEIIDAVKGGFKVLSWFGMAVKWVGGIAGALAAIWALVYSITHGGPRP